MLTPFVISLLFDDRVQWFWEVLGDFSEEDKARFLQFCTGTCRLPPHGFKALQVRFFGGYGVRCVIAMSQTPCWFSNDPGINAWTRERVGGGVYSPFDGLQGGT